MWKKIVLGPLATNCYLFYQQDKNCWIIDPAAEAEAIISTIEELQVVPRGILCTHGHLDHISAALALQEHYSTGNTKLPLYAHSEEKIWFAPHGKEAHLKEFGGMGSPGTALFHELFRGLPKIDKELTDTTMIDDSGLKTLTTPGHSRGSLVFYHQEENLLFSGDTLFHPGVGRTDLRGGNQQELTYSIQRLFREIPETTLVLPGHGSSGILRDNPLFKRYRN